MMRLNDPWLERVLFREGDRVVTPSDEIAIVVSVRMEFIGCRYRDALIRANAEFSLAPKLLARWPVGQPRPSPVRVR